MQKRTIWKFPLKITDEQIIEVPDYVEWLNVGLDPQGNPSLWALVYPDNEKVQINIRIIGTGHPVEKEIWHDNYRGTIIDGPFAWHVFQA